MLRDRQPAEDRIAELVAAKLPRRRHHPPHAERGADRFRVPAAARPGADDLLQRDYVRVYRAEHRGDPLRTRAAVDAAAAMYVVGRDAQRRARPLSHYAMIVRGVALTGWPSSRMRSAGGGHDSRLPQAAGRAADARAQHADGHQSIVARLE